MGVKSKPMLLQMLGNVACNFKSVLLPLPGTYALVPSLVLGLAAASPSPEKARNCSHSTGFLSKATSYRLGFFLSLPTFAPQMKNIRLLYYFRTCQLTQRLDAESPAPNLSTDLY